ncbi:DNA fragmentation factor subunit alpha [Protobothrops mucrosquamatus]|uniref:DNA fragmentation factor subunit alpha n=1 Tax=Protobothrops mucrosquamatus TaxID=103944 RepID=UPI000775C43F|nr:DNA fragmentation factor subunit alpha [Protobothrops mucrosquamatus]
MAEGASGLPRLKQCLIRRAGQQEQHGVAASTLQELKIKACNLLAIDLDSQPVTLVLAGDGTIVDDDDYFLCLPQNTKFGVVAKNEKWTASSNTGEGTTWLEEEITNTNEVDGGGEKWQVLARQLKNDLSTIVLMSEEDLQALIDVPCSDLARELSENPLQTQRLQRTLQETLDRREEERQSRQLLELYLQAVKREDQAASTAEASEAEEKPVGGNDTVDAGSNGTSLVQRSQLSTRVVTVLKEKPAPELSLASQDLELVCNEDSEILSRALSWDKHKTEALKEACAQEFSRRRQQFHSLNSLRTISKGKKKLSEAGKRSSSKRRK